MKKDFLTFAELSRDDVDSILDLSARLKTSRGTKDDFNPLSGKSVALIFEKPSTRTRVSFQVATSELGGSPIPLSSAELQLGRGETVHDTAQVLSRYVHCIMARVNKHSDLQDLARESSVPVINGLSDLYHPVQVLADLLTLREHKGKLRGLKVAWVGDGDNVCNSWALAAAITGVHFVAATPAGYEPAAEVLKEAHHLSEKNGGAIETVHDPDEAVAGADCVMTDTFVSMGFEKEAADRVKAFMPKFRVDSKMMAKAKSDAVFQHCLPAHRGEEVEADVIDGPQSVVFDEAENRLHTTKALLCYLLLDSKGFSSLRP